MSEQPTRKKVTLRHPTDLCLDVVVWEEMAVILRRLGYTDVVDRPADTLPDIDERGFHDGSEDGTHSDGRDGGDGQL